MREIKFRTWIDIGDKSEVTGMVYEVVPYNSSHDGNVGAFTENVNDAISNTGYQYTDGEFHHLESGEVIDGDEFNVRDIDGDWIFFEGELMQYTGLKDKNGKEIYEGDILKTVNGDWGVIVWNAPFFELTISETQSSLYTREWLSKGEVIGNIHENPELLKP